jgi:hypothetical protein
MENISWAQVTFLGVGIARAGRALVRAGGRVDRQAREHQLVRDPEAKRELDISSEQINHVWLKWLPGVEGRRLKARWAQGSDGALEPRRRAERRRHRGGAGDENIFSTTIQPPYSLLKIG